MQKADSPLGEWRNVVLFLVASLIIAADQLSKIWVRSYPEGYLIYKIGFSRLIHVHNTGGVFGLFQGQSFALAIVGFLGVILFLLLALFLHRTFPLLASMPNRIALGLILGGTVGNLLDRLRFIFDSKAGNLVERLSMGYVTDFIDFPVWPAFNVADSCLVIGVIIVAYTFLYSAITEEH